MPDLSRQCERTWVRYDTLDCPVQVPEISRATTLPDLHSVLCWIFPMGMCHDTKSRILHAQLGQAEKHRTLTNCTGMCAQHTAHADERCQITCALEWNRQRMMKKKQTQITFSRTVSLQKHLEITKTASEGCTERVARSRMVLR